MLEVAALLVAVGVSPFLAVASFGLADVLGLGTLPDGLSAMAHPVSIVVSASLGAVLHSGRSSKFTKPFAELGGLVESAFALVVGLAATLPLISALGTGGAVAFALAVLTLLTLILAVRTSLDVLVWLTPLPFVDAAFQTTKLMVAGLLVAATLISPPAALVMAGAGLLGAGLLGRWAARGLRLGWTVLGDRTWRRGELRGIPRDEVVDGDLGPFDGFALDLPGVARHAPAQVELRAGRWFLIGAGPGGPTTPDTPLGEGEHAVLARTWAGLELRIGERAVLLPPRYLPFTEQIREESRASPSPPAASSKSAREDRRRSIGVGRQTPNAS